MENNLERYKSVIRTQNTAFAAALIILVAVITLSLIHICEKIDRRCLGSSKNINF